MARTALQAGSRAQSLGGDIDPSHAELTDKVLLGVVWDRPGLSQRWEAIAGPL